MNYLITDRRLYPRNEDLAAAIARRRPWAVQVREKDLPARELAAYVRQVIAIAGDALVFVNTRVDVALACGAAGAHLPSASPAPSMWRTIVPAVFRFGVSCHTLEELRAAEAGGADFAVYGPVFPPRSKVDQRPPIGLAGLATGCRAVRIPVLALGGITWENDWLCRQAGAAGVAGITLFSEP